MIAAPRRLQTAAGRRSLGTGGETRREDPSARPKRLPLRLRQGHLHVQMDGVDTSVQGMRGTRTWTKGWSRRLSFRAVYCVLWPEVLYLTCIQGILEGGGRTRTMRTLDREIVALERGHAKSSGRTVAGRPLTLFRSPTAYCPTKI